MNITTFYNFSGVFIIIVALGFTISQIGITKIFNYPMILRSDTSNILVKFKEGGSKLRFFWALFAFSSLMLAPLSTIFYKILNGSDSPYMIISVAFGICAGIFYVVGLMRWVFLADTLSKKYTSTENKTSKDIIETVFEAFHVYSGNSLGETMGFFCMGVWLAISGFAMTSSKLFALPAGIGLIICGAGIAAGPLEWVGLKFCNKINKISLKLLMLIFIYVGIKLIIY